MNDPIPSNTFGWPQWFARAAGIVGSVVGVLVLFGWTFDLSALQSIGAGWTRMAPLTALGFLLTGIAISLLAAQGANSDRQTAPARLVPALAAAVVIVGALRLGAYLVGWNLRIDTLWFHEPNATPGNETRLAPATATAFLLLGLSVLLVYLKRFFPALQAFAFITALVAWLGLSHYVYGGAPLVSFANMAVHTAVTFLILSAGILSLHSNRGLMALLTSDTEGGLIARRLVPSALIFPILLGWLRLKAQQAGLIGTEAGVSLLSLANILVFGALIWRSALLLSRSDEVRQKTEQSLRDSQARLESALESGGIGTWSYDVATNESWLDDSLTTILGRTRTDLEGGRPEIFFQFVHPEDAARAEAAFENAVRVTGDYRAEFRYIHPEGTVIWLAVRGRFQDDKKRMTGACVDITERKYAENRLQVQLSRLELLNQITRAIGERQDLRSIYQVVIRRLEDDLPVDFGCICHYDGLSDSIIIMSVGSKQGLAGAGSSIAEQTQIQIEPNGLARSLRGQLVYEPELTEITLAFPRQLFEAGLRSLVAAPLLVESKVFGLLVVARSKPHGFSSPDCEFLRQLGEQVALAANHAQIYTALQEAYDELRSTQLAVLEQERLRALGQMASGVAHDINNALSPVMLYTETLLETETNLSAKGRESLETVQRAIDDVAHTVARLRDFYRPRESQAQFTAINLNALVQQTIELTRARWRDMLQQHGRVIEVVTDLKSELPSISGDAADIREALTNLIFNAVDAMPNGGTLTIRTRTASGPYPENRSGVVQLEVSDTGIGMDEETKRKCLEPFFTTKGERGTGLGLAMVYGATERHQAEIEIESEPQAGTTIRLSFHVQPADSSTSPVMAKEALSPSPLRILIVDDDPLLIKTLSDTLEADGHEVVVASGGKEGIETFTREIGSGQSFDVVITDLGMPHVDGRQVASAVKKEQPSIPIILFTGWGQRLVDEGSVPPNVDCVLNKPPKLRELREALVRCLKPK